jgi:hypothetical protein
MRARSAPLAADGLSGVAGAGAGAGGESGALAGTVVAGRGGGGSEPARLAATEPKGAAEAADLGAGLRKTKKATAAVTETAESRRMVRGGIGGMRLSDKKADPRVKRVGKGPG